MIETKYIDLFKKQRDVLDRKSVKELNSLRADALANFERLGFPTKKMEDYSYVDLAASFKPNLALDIERSEQIGNSYKDFQSNIPLATKNLFFVQNDIQYTKERSKLSLPASVFAGTMQDFSKKNPEILSKYYGQVADIKENALAAFNTSFVQDGFVVYVPKNTVVEEPLQLINLLEGTKDRIVNRRILIIAEENAQVKLLSCDHTVDKAKYLITQVTEIFVAKNARVDFYELEENSANVVRLTNTFVDQAENSNLVVNNITLQSGLTRNNYYVNLKGEYAESYVCGMVIADEKQFVDNFAFLDHLVPNCTSTQLFKYVLQDNAVGSFCGRIRVERDAQKTMAYQTNNNLCISPNARMYSKPQLEIYADDVKCSHGLTTGELNKDALLYMRSRGVSEYESQLMLMQAFVSEVLDHIRIDELRDNLAKLIEERFKGQTAKSADCVICK